MRYLRSLFPPLAKKTNLEAIRKLAKEDVMSRTGFTYVCDTCHETVEAPKGNSSIQDSIWLTNNGWGCYINEHLCPVCNQKMLITSWEQELMKLDEKRDVLKERISDQRLVLEKLILRNKKDETP
jgi:hypothetical protein